MTLAHGYDAMKEDPNIYKTLDLCGYAAPRQFPDMQLPVPGTPTPAQQSSTTSTPGQFIPEHLITAMQHMHDDHVCFLKSLGRGGIPVLISRRRMKSESSELLVQM